jgi:hypothetical protein
MRKKNRVFSSEEDDLTLSKSPPTNKKFKMDNHDFYDGLSEDYYSSPKPSSRKRRSTRIEVVSKPAKYALRSRSEHSSDANHINSKIDQDESDDSTSHIEKHNRYSRPKRAVQSPTSEMRLGKFTRRDQLRNGDASFSVRKTSPSPTYDQDSQNDKSPAPEGEEFSENEEGSMSDSDDEVWQEEEEEDDDDFLDLDMGDDRRMTRSRKAFYPKGDDGRSLRKKTPVNYASQMYPQAFQVVDALVELDKTNNLPLGFNQKNSLNGNRSWGFNVPRTPSKLFRLNEVTVRLTDWIGRRRTANWSTKG